MSKEEAVTRGSEDSLYLPFDPKEAIDLVATNFLVYVYESYQLSILSREGRTWRALCFQSGSIISTDEGAVLDACIEHAYFDH